MQLGGFETKNNNTPIKVLKDEKAGRGLAPLRLNNRRKKTLTQRCELN